MSDENAVIREYTLNAESAIKTIELHKQMMKEI